MTGTRARAVCITPHPRGVGGMVSFHDKLTAGLRRRGVRVTYDLGEADYSAILVIGGTRRFWELRRARQQGIPVVQRLDGMNWLHRRLGVWRSGLNHYLRAEYGNLVLRLIRSRLATYLIYQSEFVRRWWEESHGTLPIPWRVIYNGVDLEHYTPQGVERPPEDRWRLLMIEGNLMGGYELGLRTALALVEHLAQTLGALARPVELVVAGRVPEALRRRSEAWLQRHCPSGKILWPGIVAPRAIPSLAREAHLLFAADLNPACPNAVVEALACGLPVLAFATGALPEMIPSQAGRLVPYGGDPWKLEEPDIPALAQAALEVFQAGEALRRGARRLAEERFDVEAMVDAYQEVLLGGSP